MTNAAVSPAGQRLVQLMHELYFGRIEGLWISGGVPIFEPAPRVVRHIKLGGDNGLRPELEHSDFELKSQIMELFEHFVKLGNGQVETLEVQHGLPFRLIVENAV